MDGVLNPDVVVVGAGVSGLVCASLLADQGKRVVLLEKSDHLGGRAMERRYKGHQLGLGSHLVEDPGDSLTRVCEQIGVPLVHSGRSDSMPFWNDGRWQHIQDYYGPGGKQDLKRCIDALLALDYSDLDSLDHLSLREWMAQYTDAPGVYLVWEAISVLEQITTKWWEHSASENLYARKLHYSTKRTAGYSFWPMGGWDKLWRAMAAAFERLGGEVRRQAAVRQVIVENGAVRGVELAPSARVPAPVNGSRPDEVVRQCAGVDAPRAVRRRRAPVGPARPDQVPRRQPQPRLLARLLDRRQGTGHRHDRAGDGLLPLDAAVRAAGLHPQLHRLRPRRLARGGVPDLRRRLLRRDRALRRQGLVRPQVRRAVGSTSRR